MKKSRYILESAIKNLFRMNELILNSVLLLLLTFFTFLSFYAFLFFSYWIQWIKTDAMKTDGTVQSVVSVVSNIELFKGIVLLIFILLFIVSISYLYRMMVQYFEIYQNDYIIMTFIGEKNFVLGMEYALQGSFMTLTIFSLGDVFARFIFLNRLSATAKLGPLSDVFENFYPRIFTHVVLIIGGTLYIFFRLFFYVKKQLNFNFADRQQTYR